MIQYSQMLQKTAVVFAKTGPAIYHSHHDMIRFWERAIKRADLPMRLTQGFNPRPRIIFPHALGLGIASRHEEVELELHARIDLRILLERIKHAAGDTLGILDAFNLPPVKKSRQLVASSYTITGWAPESLPRLGETAQSILALPEIVVERGAPGNRRTLDIRPFIAGLTYDDGDAALRLDLSHSNAGSARPDEVGKLAASMLKDDAYGLAIEKVAMRLE
ncbi:MAG: TIGR03936 family radical SAM-associated protein [Planctomycetaceae bacterium]|nr:TIGR03936 family radical SAM-associated protein [Planctomycetaceae bacterium]